MQEILLSDEPLQMSSVEEYVRTNSEGAQVYFNGTPRSKKQNEEVISLFFEAYAPMAIKEMVKIKEKATRVFDLQVVVMHHRLGECKRNEIAVIVGVGALHRKQAYEASIWIMDEIKSVVPIWKKETLANGAFWVTPNP